MYQNNLGPVPSQSDRLAHGDEALMIPKLSNRIHRCKDPDGGDTTTLTFDSNKKDRSFKSVAQA